MRSKKLNNRIDQHYKIWENIILKKERNREREEAREKLLNDDELEQEAYEISKLEEIRKMYLPNTQDDDSPDGIGELASHHKQQLYYTNRDDYLNDLHIEVLANLYNCEIKLGQELQVIHDQSSKLLQMQGFQEDSDASTDLGSTLSSKFSKKYTKNLTKARKEFKELQQTYKETGKIRKIEYVYFYSTWNA